MLFNSPEYIIFLPLVVFIYSKLSPIFRIYFLLFCSYFFYMYWKPEYAILLIFSTFIDFQCSKWIFTEKRILIRKILLWLSIFINLGLLSFIKYFDFLLNNLNIVLNFSGNHIQYSSLDLILPIGISFYTFQTLSYTIDVYRSKITPERNFGKFALYVSFFPQLVAGPIERAERLLPQLNGSYHFDYQNIVSGMKLIFWGLFKKMVIADRIAEYTDLVYTSPHHFQSASVIIATFFFGFQIYCDFSGYCDVAIGSASLLNIKLMNNFNFPYFSENIILFWKKWHISLSSWFKDYLYIPLGGNRKGKILSYLFILITFTVSGLWHGDKWTFVLWGIYHGILYIIYKLIFFRNKTIISENKIYSNFKKAITISITFNLVCFGWIIFRSNSVKDLSILLNKLFLTNFRIKDLFIFEYRHFTISIGLVFILLLAEWLSMNNILLPWFSKQPLVLRWVMYFTAIIIFLMFMVTDSKQFIYFQF